MIYILLSSQKKVTQAIYVKVWKVFNPWLLTNKVSLGILLVQDFLQDSVDQGV